MGYIQSAWYRRFFAGEKHIYKNKKWYVVDPWCFGGLSILFLTHATFMSKYGINREGSNGQGSA
jgi:hypothetical protein